MSLKNVRQYVGATFAFQGFHYCGGGSTRHEMNRLAREEKPRRLSGDKGQRRALFRAAKVMCLLCVQTVN